MTIGADRQLHLLTTDRDGAMEVRSTAMAQGPRIDHAGAGCRIASAQHEKWPALFACRGEDAGRLFIVDSQGMTTTARLEASTDRAVSQVAINADAQQLWPIAPGFAGTIVRYCADRRCQNGQLSIPQLRAAWVYP